MKSIIYLFVILIIATACTSRKEADVAEKPTKGESKMDYIGEKTRNEAIDSLLAKYGEENKFRIERGVQQAASFWTVDDGTKEKFVKFCVEKFVIDEKELDKVFKRISDNLETIYGHLHQIDLQLEKPVDLTGYDLLDIDKIYAAYNPYSHLTEDFFKNKIAFIVLLNFPHYSLDEKIENGGEWSRKQWAYARAGDLYTSRVPAELLSEESRVMTEADEYINNYNIYVGYLQDNEGQTYFPKDLKLISHWNLRDQIKSEYGNVDALKKQKLIYEAMKRIITQEIPETMIDSDKYQWNPYKNEVYKEGEKVEFKPEPNSRYKHILKNFEAKKKIDEYYPDFDTYVDRRFDKQFEIPYDKVEELFTGLLSSPAAKKVGALIKQRLDRDLQPFDIWYDGFKARSGMDQEKLNKMTRTKYPDPQSFKEDMPRILRQLGFSSNKAEFLMSKIEVEPSRGAGHAAGAEMRSANSHLRTRIGEKGMDYKGYNIAIHEFGHNVEQTTTLHDVDYYMLNGVPNTAFTEAWAFIFQKRDLELLGISQQNPNEEALRALDNFWSAYEIMGVSLVDMRVWKWLYENPKAAPGELKNKVIEIAENIWNDYYAEIFGVKDQPILAIYSHMIDYPLYLPAYPIGNLIEFQIEKHIKDKNLAKEMIRMLKQGDILPKYWMEGAVGKGISIEPLVEAADKAADKMMEKPDA